MDVMLNQSHRPIGTLPAASPPDSRGAEVASRLAASGYPSLRNVHCQCRDGVMVLSGTVRSYYLKQMAQTVAGKTDGVGRVENQLEVRTVR